MYRFITPITCSLIFCSSAGLAVAQTNTEASPNYTLSPIEVTGDAATPGSFELEDIKKEQALTPGGIDTIDSQALHERSVNNMADLLRYSPGVMAESQTGGDEVRLHIRGSNLNATDYNNNGVLLLQDGLPITTADGNNHNRLLDPNNVRHATVARGANALKFGASTLGGAINFTTPTALNSNPNQLYMQGGSFGTFDFGASTGGSLDKLDGIVSVGRKRHNGYRQHSHGETTQFNANAGWLATPDLELRLFASYIDSKQQLAGGLTRDEFKKDPRQANQEYVDGNHQVNTKSSRVAAKGTWTIDGNSTLEFGLAYEHQSLFHPIVFNPYYQLLIDTDQDNYAGMLRYNLIAGDHNILVGSTLQTSDEKGGNYDNLAGGHHGALQNKVHATANTQTLYAIDRWGFAPNWTLVYGAQGVSTRRNDKERGEKDNYSAVNPRLGLIYNLAPKAQAYASVSHLFEAPINAELDGRRSDLKNDNATLKAMRGWVYEIGLRGDYLDPHSWQWHWDVSTYYTKIHNEILSKKAPNGRLNVAENFDRTTHAGVEALASVKIPAFNGHIEPLVSATYSHFRFDNDDQYGNNELPAIPHYALHSQLLYRDQSGFYAGPTYDFIGARYGDYSNTYKVSSHWLLGLRTGYKHDNWEIFAEGRNLTDKDYVANISPQDIAGNSDAVLMPGGPRSVYAGIRYNF